jgi:rubrerythrin
MVASYPAGIMKDTKTNLETVAACEKMEWTTIYADFPKIAVDEGFHEVGGSFEQIAKVEKFHESRYRKLAGNVGSGEVFKKKRPVKWHCINCGYTYEGTEAPR